MISWLAGVPMTTAASCTPGSSRIAFATSIRVTESWYAEGLMRVRMVIGNLVRDQETGVRRQAVPCPQRIRSTWRRLMWRRAPECGGPAP